MDAQEFGGEFEGLAVVEIDLDFFLGAVQPQLFRKRPVMAMVVPMPMPMVVIVVRMIVPVIVAP